MTHFIYRYYLFYLTRSIRVIYWVLFNWTFDTWSLAVSYPNQKVHLKWDDAGVVLNPELKLLQYNLGQPLEVSESIEYMPQKHGKINANTNKFAENKCETLKISCQLGQKFVL